MLMGTMPVRGTSEIVGLRPTTPLLFDGPIMEPPVSVPTVAAAKLVAAAMPEPELDPAGDAHAVADRVVRWLIHHGSDGHDLCDGRRDFAVGVKGRVERTG